MDEQKTQIVDKLKQATNILVTVSSSPSVDQLSAAIGLTLFLNKLGKHGSAVYSGKTPSAIQFLEPQKTLEKTTDSLRDFIIALDKAKADKLRYKVEDEMVKIFITPYQTSITEKDLEFSHGDFNVEVVMALGVKEQGELDQAITAHGSILHDATVYGVGAGDPPVALGSSNWNDPKASSLSEMVASLCVAIKPDSFDAQMATAMLTGIVAETERFSNEKTSSETMQISAKLMHAGANQQLVASELQQPSVQAPAETGDNAELPELQEDGTPAEDKPSSDGSLHITHGDITPVDEESNADSEPELPALEQIHIDENGMLLDNKQQAMSHPAHEKVLQPPSKDTSPRLVLAPPTAASTPATKPPEKPVIDPAVAKPLPQPPALNSAAPKKAAPVVRQAPQAADSPDPEDTVIVQPTNAKPTVVLPPPPKPEQQKPLDALASPAKANPTDPSTNVSAARNAVEQAMGSKPAPAIKPLVVLSPPPPAPAPPKVPQEENDPGLPPGFTSLVNPTPAPAPIIQPVVNPTAPPPVPPPMMPPVLPQTNPPADSSPGATAL